MPRSRRYLLIVGLLLLAVLVAATWQLIKARFPNVFDQETVDAAEVEKLKATDLTRQTTVANTDWWQFRGPNRDGIATADGFNTDWAAKPPKQLWSAPCGGGYSSCAVVGAVVYTQDRQGANERVLALDAETGKPRWVFEYPADYTGLTLGYTDGPRATPTVVDDKLYAVGAVGHFVCLKLPTKADEQPSMLWDHDLRAEFRATLPQWGYACSPLIEGDLVIVQPAGRDGAVAAFDRTTGDRRWAVSKTTNGYSSPVAATLGGVRQVVAVTGDAVLGIRVPDGKLMWEHPWTTQQGVNAAMPIVIGEFVFVSSDYGKGCVLLRVTSSGENTTSARPVYFKPGGRGFKSWHSSAVHRDNFLYGFDSQEFRCFDLKEQSLVEGWAAKDAGNSRIDKGTVTLVGDKLLIQSQTGSLYLADADPTEFKFRGKLPGVLSGSQCWATPTVVGGRIFTRDGEKVVCLDARK